MANPFTPRHQCSVWRHSSDTDDNGQPRAPECIRRNVPCDVSAVSGNEAEIGRQNVAVLNYSVRLYQSTKTPITPNCWLVWRGRKLQVEFVPPTSRDFDLCDISCTEEVGK
jgi:hypothetical protein